MLHLLAKLKMMTGSSCRCLIILKILMMSADMSPASALFVPLPRPPLARPLPLPLPPPLPPASPAPTSRALVIKVACIWSKFSALKVMLSSLICTHSNSCKPFSGSNARASPFHLHQCSNINCTPLLKDLPCQTPYCPHQAHLSMQDLVRQAAAPMWGTLGQIPSTQTVLGKTDTKKRPLPPIGKA